MNLVVAIILLPLYIYLIRVANQDDANHTCKSSWWLRAWAILQLVVFAIICLIFAVGGGLLLWKS